MSLWPCPVEDCVGIATFKDRRTLLGHLKRFHRYDNYFLCKIDRCGNEYGTYASYLVHVYRLHRVTLATSAEQQKPQMKLKVTYKGRSRMIVVKDKSDVEPAIFKEFSKIKSADVYIHYEHAVFGWVEFHCPNVEIFDMGVIRLIDKKNSDVLKAADFYNPNLGNDNVTRAPVTEKDERRTGSEFLPRSSRISMELSRDKISSTTTVEEDSPSRDGDRCDNHTDTVSQNSTVKIRELKEWPGANYKVHLLPHLDYQLKKLPLKCGASPALKSTIVKKISDDLIESFGLTPPSHAKIQACYSLVNQYPVLNSTLTNEDPQTSPYSYWLRKIHNKLADIRRKINDTNDPVLIANRTKFGRGGAPRQPPMEAEESSLTSPRCKKPRQGAIGTESRENLDNDKRLADHKEFILSESSSSNPPRSKLIRAMNATYESRRLAIETRQMTTANVMAEYPVLKDSFWILEEMKRITNGLNIVEKIRNKAMCSRFIEKVKWGRLPMRIKALLESAKLCWMVGIPTICNERYDRFLVVDKDIMASPNPIMHLNSENLMWTVRFDGFVFQGIPDFPFALAVMLSLHWVFNCEFEKSVNNSMHFLSMVIAEIKGLKAPPKVASILL